MYTADSLATPNEEEEEHANDLRDIMLYIYIAKFY